jgi:hypothetical protein
VAARNLWELKDHRLVGFPGEPGVIFSNGKLLGVWRSAVSAREDHGRWVTLLTGRSHTPVTQSMGPEQRDARSTRRGDRLTDLRAGQGGQHRWLCGRRGGRDWLGRADVNTELGRIRAETAHETFYSFLFYPLFSFLYLQVQFEFRI